MMDLTVIIDITNMIGHSNMMNMTVIMEITERMNMGPD